MAGEEGAGRDADEQRGHAPPHAQHRRLGGRDKAVRVFATAEVRQIIARLEFVHTPGHSGRLTLAELELSVLAWQSLERRLPDRKTLAREAAAWEAERYAAVVNCQPVVTTADARAKVKR